MIELRTPAEIDAMRPAGRFVAEVLATLRDETHVGTNLLAIDKRAHEMIRAAGAESCYIDYHPSFGASPFGKVICTSINDAVLHGLPHDYALRDGHPPVDRHREVERDEVAHADGYSINTDFGGHGVGRVMHGDPHVPNDGKPNRGYPLRPGLVVALEPWFLQTTDELVTDPDGWTLRSVDGSRGAHAEHTVAITADGPIILTDRSFLGVD